MGTSQSISYKFPRDNVPTKRALLIGFDYSGQNTLKGSENDIKLAKKTLMETYGFEEKNIFPFTNGNLNSMLTSFINSSIPGDINFIHYSGHATETNNNVEILVNEDLSIITSKQIFNILNKPNITTVLVVDACDSALIAGLPIELDKRTGADLNSNIISLSASEDHKLSFESIHGDATFGTFSYLLDNYVAINPDQTWTEVIRNVRTQLQTEIPTLSVSKQSLLNERIRNVL